MIGGSSRLWEEMALATGRSCGYKLEGMRDRWSFVSVISSEHYSLDIKFSGSQLPDVSALR